MKKYTTKYKYLVEKFYSKQEVWDTFYKKRECFSDIGPNERRPFYGVRAYTAEIVKRQDEDRLFLRYISARAIHEVYFVTFPAYLVLTVKEEDDGTLVAVCLDMIKEDAFDKFFVEVSE